MKQEAAVPEQFASTELSPCPSRGKGPRIVYVVALFVGLYLLTLSELGIVGGIAVILYALNRLLSSRNLRGNCPYCRKPQSGLRPKSGPFSCKTCGHRLAIYGDRLADISAGMDDGTTGTRQKGTSGAITPDVIEHVEFIKRYRTSQLAGSLAVIGVLAWWLSGSGEKAIGNHIADNLSQQYVIAQRQGNMMDMCVQAGATALSYLNVHDEANYAHWKAIEDADCKAASMR